MLKISDTIIEPGTEEKKVNKTRTTVRGIIYKNNKLLMVYAKKFNDYTFPGGGKKKDEDMIEALQRELKEELGAKEILNIKPFGYIEEKRYGISGSDSVYLQTSYYFTLDINGKGEQILEAREIEHGVDPQWIDIDEAIKANELAISKLNKHKGMMTVLPREVTVLKYLKKQLIKEGIDEEV
ncbi:NUDIX hydrolase [Acholeplasma granularum]|uniref:NUDIX hydrolase n=1 Tax=Acholeplasma granularum TaxID=264635 RepID=UPI0004B18480|nr:NUDIX domain-containing protein [Acholeplasma granularum]